MGIIETHCKSMTTYKNKSAGPLGATRLFACKASQHSVIVAVAARLANAFQSVTHFKYTEGGKRANSHTS